MILSFNDIFISYEEDEYEKEELLNINTMLNKDVKWTFITVIENQWYKNIKYHMTNNINWNNINVLTYNKKIEWKELYYYLIIWIVNNKWMELIIE